MQNLAGEGAGDFRGARQMVMAVGDDQRAIEARPLLALDLHAPAAVDGTLGAGDRGVQLDLVEDVEIHGVGA